MTRTFKNLLLGFAFFVLVAAGSWILAPRVPPATITRLDHAGIILGFGLACFSLAGIAVALLRMEDLRRLIERWLRRKEFENAGREVEEFEKRVEAVVIPVGLQATQAEWIVRQLRPRCVSLLFTKESRSAAAELAGKLEAEFEFVPPQHEIKGSAMVIDDFLDSQESRDIVRYYLEQFLDRGFRREGIFVDTTGATAPMSLGAFQAAEELQISSIYVRGLSSEAGRKGRIVDPQDLPQAVVQFVSDHTGVDQSGGD